VGVNGEMIDAITLLDFSRERTLLATEVAKNPDVGKAE
jgi:hypothetical protein